MATTCWNHVTGAKRTSTYFLSVLSTLPCSEWLMGVFSHLLQRQGLLKLQRLTCSLHVLSIWRKQQWSLVFQLSSLCTQPYTSSSSQRIFDLYATEKGNKYSLSFIILKVNSVSPWREFGCRATTHNVVTETSASILTERNKRQIQKCSASAEKSPFYNLTNTAEWFPVSRGTCAPLARIIVFIATANARTDAKLAVLRQITTDCTEQNICFQSWENILGLCTWTVPSHPCKVSLVCSCCLLWVHAGKVSFFNIRHLYYSTLCYAALQIELTTITYRTTLIFR